MRSRFVPILTIAAILAAVVFAAVVAKPAESYPLRATTCTSCHPAAPAGISVSATPSTATPAVGATYTVTVNLVDLTSSGDTGYWITNAAGTPSASVYGGDIGTNQTTYTQTMTAPATPGTYTYTVWCERGSKSSGQAKSTTYSVTVPAPPAATAAITSLSPNHGLTGSSVVIAGTNLGSGGTVSFGGTPAATGPWSATSVTATVPVGISPGAVSVTVTPTGAAAASNVLSYTVDAPPAATDDIAPATVATGATDGRWYKRGVTIHLAASDDPGGSGVASITYFVDGGTPVTMGGATTDVDLKVDPDGTGKGTVVDDGTHTVTYYATDVAGKVETAHALLVNFDTRKPVTKSPRGAKVRRYQRVKLNYEVDDAAPNGGTAKVVIVIKNRRGSTVKVLRLGSKPVNKALATSFRCVLRTGVYTFTVKATDLAGNAQATAATRTVTVYPAS